MPSSTEPGAAPGTPKPNLLDDDSAGSLAELLFSSPVIGLGVGAATDHSPPQHRDGDGEAEDDSGDRPVGGTAERHDAAVGEVDRAAVPGPASPAAAPLERLERGLPPDLRPGPDRPSGEGRPGPEPWPDSDFAPVLGPDDGWLGSAPGPSSDPGPVSAPGPAADRGPGSGSTGGPSTVGSGPDTGPPSGSAGGPETLGGAEGLASRTAPLPTNRESEPPAVESGGETKPSAGAGGPQRRVPPVVAAGSSALFLTRDRPPSAGADPALHLSEHTPLFEGPGSVPTGAPADGHGGGPADGLFADLAPGDGFRWTTGGNRPVSFSGGGDAPAHDRDLFGGDGASSGGGPQPAPAHPGPERGGFLPVTLLEAAEHRWFRATVAGVVAMIFALVGFMALNLRGGAETDAIVPDRLTQIDSAGVSAADTVPGGPALASVDQGPEGTKALTPTSTSSSPAEGSPVDVSGTIGGEQPSTIGDTAGTDPVGGAASPTSLPSTSAGSTSSAPPTEPAPIPTTRSTTSTAVTTTRPPGTAGTTTTVARTTGPPTTPAPTTTTATATMVEPTTTTTEPTTTTTESATTSSTETTVVETTTSVDTTTVDSSGTGSSTSSSVSTGGGEGGGRSGPPPDSSPRI